MPILSNFPGGGNPGAAIDSHNADPTAHLVQLEQKVDKVQGKGLSENDFTNADKQKLSGIADNANNYSHPETHPSSMIEGLITAIEERIAAAASNYALAVHYHIDPNDTSWETLQLINCATWTEASTPRIRRLNGVVYVSGGIKLTANLAANSSIDIVTSMPEAARPLVTDRSVPLTSDRGQFRLLVYQNGTLRLTNRTGTQITPSQFISLESSWIV